MTPTNAHTPIEPPSAGMREIRKLESGPAEPPIMRPTDRVPSSTSSQTRPPPRSVHRAAPSVPPIAPSGFAFANVDHGDIGAPRRIPLRNRSWVAAPLGPEPEVHAIEIPARRPDAAAASFVRAGGSGDV